MVCHHPAKFGGHGHCGSGQTFFICHVNTCLKGHVTLWMAAPYPKSPRC